MNGISLPGFQIGSGVTGFVVAQTFIALTATFIALRMEKETKNWPEMTLP